MKRILVLTFLLLIAIAQPENCFDYLTNVYDLFQTNRSAAELQMAPYLTVSGKFFEDLGFWERCQLMKNTSYSTLEFSTLLNQFNLTAYYGLCMNAACNASEINQNSQAMINILKLFNVTFPGNSTFKQAVSPRLYHSLSGATIAMIVVFCVIIAVEMIYSVKKWVFLCFNKQDVNQRYTFEDGEVYQQEEMTFLRKISLEYKLSQLFSTNEKTNKIISFSMFKVFCVPLIILGQQFYFRNFAAYNVFSFKEQIYQSFYSKVAVFSIYLPDVLFFISAYLLSTKCLQNEANIKFLSSQLLKKVIRLYPLYIAILIIYWLISPSMHQGPVWYVYQNQSAVCNHNWWASFLLINNWFSNTCYAGAWFVEAQFQFVLFSLVFFFLFAKFKAPAIGFYLVSLIVMIVLTIVLSSKMPVSIENSVSDEFKNFYISSYGHFLFYLFGMGVAFLRNLGNISEKIIEFFQNKKFIDYIIQAFGLGIILLVLFRPSIWDGGSQFQFALSRLGVFLGFLTFFMGGIFQSQDHQNSSFSHRLAHYSYPVMLISPIVTLSSVWGVGSFSYVNGLNLLNFMVTQTLLSIVLGVFIGLLVEVNVFSKKSQ